MRLLNAAALVALVALALWSALWTPPVVAATAPATAFSAERAMSHVRAIASRPHPISSATHDEARTYVESQLAALGMTVDVQRATGMSARYPAAGRVQNVVGRLRGRNPGGKAVLLMAHYDGVPAAPGAGDDGAGTAALLETMRALKAGAPLANDVIALFTDGEEAGLLGAAAFARQHPWAKDVGVVLDFEARGTHGPSLMFETGRGNLDVVRMLRRAPNARATSLSTMVYRALPNDTDLSELLLLELPAMNFAFIGGVERYHTAEDDLAHLDASSVQHHGQQALALARAFGDEPFPRPTTGDAVFFNLPLLGIILYPEALAPAFAILALGLLVWLLRSAKPRVRDVAIGAGGTVVTFVLAALVAPLLVRLASAIHLAIGSGAPEWSATYAVIHALVTLAVTMLAWRLCRRWSDTRALWFGALCVWALLALVTSFVGKGVSFFFVWPALAAIGAALVSQRRAAWSAAAGWASAAIAALLVIPTMYLMVCVALGLTTMGAPVFAALAALLAWLIAPRLESALPDGWKGPGVLAIASVVVLCIGAATVRTGASHPAGTSFQYYLDADQARAWMVPSGRTPVATTWMTRALRDAHPAAGATAGTPPARFGRRAVEVPAAALKSAELRVVSDSALPAGNRRVRFVVRAPSGAYSVGMALDTTVMAATLDGHVIDSRSYRERPGRWHLDFVYPPESGLEIALDIPGSAPRQLELNVRTIGVPVPLPQRPPGFIAAQSGDYSTVVRRLKL